MEKILVIDDEPAFLEFTSELLRSSGYEVLAFSDPREAVLAFSYFRPDLCVLDFTLPGITGRDVCRTLKEVDPTVEVIFLTGEADTELAIEMMKLGAVDYLLKPASPSQIKASATRALEHRRLVRENKEYRERLESSVVEKTKALNETLQELEVVYDATLETLGLALDFRDQSTGGHSVRVAHLTRGIAAEIGVEGDTLVQIEQGALLHDVGKLRIPDSILLKPGKLTSAEWEVMRRHPEYGNEFLQKIGFLSAAANIVYTHHEKFDGSGYPQGLRGKQIPIGARCFAIVDAVDALIYDRPYHRATTFEEAAAEIRRCSGSHFDPDLVEVGLAYIARRLHPASAKRVSA